MTSMVLTQSYLEPQQKKALTLQAKKVGRNVSDLIRDAVDALLLGVNTEELKQLDRATLHAQKEIRAMIKDLQEDAREHAAFMAKMKRLRKAA